MIRLSNGHEMDFLVASGALGFTGNGYFWEQPLRWLGYIKPSEFTIITKTLTHQARVGNLRWWCPWRCVRLLKGGTVNAVGLTNPGLKYWIDRYYPVARGHGYKIIVSISPENVAKAIEMAGVLATLGIVGIEVNVSCPNVEHHSEAVDLVNAVVANTDHPVIVKLGISAYKPICLALDGKIAAFDLINAVPWKLLRGEEVSPLACFGGGAISGVEIKELAREACYWCRTHCKTPVISGGGIDSLDEVYARFVIGARAVSIGTLFLRRPWLPNKIVSKTRKAMAKSPI